VTAKFLTRRIDGDKRLALVAALQPWPCCLSRMVRLRGRRCNILAALKAAVSKPSVNQSSTIQSRATGGVAGGTYLFALPASPAPAATAETIFSNGSSTAASAPATSWS
jgi:hypothetical protein